MTELRSSVLTYRKLADKAEQSGDTIAARAFRKLAREKEEQADQQEGQAMLYVVIWIDLGGQWGIGGVADGAERAQELRQHWEKRANIVFVRIEHCLVNEINV